MNTVALSARQTGFALLGRRRDARAMIFTVVMPIVLLVLFNSIFGTRGSTTPVHGSRLSIHAYFMAGIIAYAIMLNGFSSLLIGFTTDREAGRLKRYRGTPMPPGVFLGAEIIANIVVIAAMVVTLLLIGRVAYNIAIPTSAFGPIVVYVVLGTATMCSLGIAATRLTTTPDAASAIGPFATVILGFISGTFVPVSQLPGWLEQIGRVFPLAHLAQGLQGSLVAGSGLDATNVAVLAAWAVAGLVVAVRTFRWEPLAAQG
ncbi:MAG TPA: ABC transporter permease [Acidimicrobiia bacterium]|nr:ABC transporter permease [Acidimicrobiia bacterium]